MITESYRLLDLIIQISEDDFMDSYEYSRLTLLTSGEYEVLFFNRSIQIYRLFRV